MLTACADLAGRLTEDATPCSQARSFLERFGSEMRRTPTSPFRSYKCSRRSCQLLSIHACSVLWVRNTRASAARRARMSVLVPRLYARIWHRSSMAAAALAVEQECSSRGRRLILTRTPCLFALLFQGLEHKNTQTIYIMGVISFGVAIASYGMRASHHTCTHSDKPAHKVHRSSF